MDLMVSASVEDDPDYEETARIATLAFGRENAPFAPSRFEWFYNCAFSEGATIVRLTDDRTGQKVGQIALVNHAIATPDGVVTTSEMVDLFVLPDYRGSKRLRTLFDEVERQFRDQDIRFSLGVPNKKSLSVNDRFFHLKPYRKLDIRGGVRSPLGSQKPLFSEEVTDAGASHVAELFAPYATCPHDAGLIWDGPRMAARLANPVQRYGLHGTPELALVSSPRTFRNMPITLLIGFFSRGGETVSKNSVSALVAAATRLWRRPAFLYIGVHSAIEALPGWPLADWMRFSPMTLHLRDFAPDGLPLDLDRFQLIDFDFG
ncbi:GNAT family N-acetyltransferase [Notoacmeibacter ruber]|uniref:GNAT family N-acetyltransferase n=1 Tax=Notoacmeibacter ruber TaxID=2670375 RepID=A0A3L7J8S5_9HYPH|nr:GNAT family N-acetyltransferase [Notoacmeibacter ruber]RLQ86930.1 GNAT family N-acetyltransferase [Notoacmeibacter ruber]